MTGGFSRLEADDFIRNNRTKFTANGLQTFKRVRRGKWDHIVLATFHMPNGRTRAVKFEGTGPGNYTYNGEYRASGHDL